MLVDFLKNPLSEKLAAGFFKGDTVATVKRDKSKAQALIKNLGNLDGAGVRVGFFEGSKYDNGTPVAQVAAAQEFGSPAQGIPPRSFMRQAIAQKSRWWAQLVKAGMDEVAEGKQTTPHQVWDKVGLKAAGDVRKAISKVMAPALKKSTIDARRRKMADGKTVGNLTKPLVDSGVMFNAVTHEVHP
jgi:hypothetical protein